MRRNMIQPTLHWTQVLDCLTLHWVVVFFCFCWTISPTRKLRCCGAQLLRNFHVFAQPRNFCHGAQLPRNFGSFWTVFISSGDSAATHIRPSFVHPPCPRSDRRPCWWGRKTLHNPIQIEGRHKPLPRALPVSGGRARVSVVIARTDLSGARRATILLCSVCFVHVVVVCSPASAACCTTSLQPLKSDCQSTAYISADGRTGLGHQR